MWAVASQGVSRRRSDAAARRRLCRGGERPRPVSAWLPARFPSIPAYSVSSSSSRNGQMRRSNPRSAASTWAHNAGDVRVREAIENVQGRFQRSMLEAVLIAGQLDRIGQLVERGCHARTLSPRSCRRLAVVHKPLGFPAHHRQAQPGLPGIDYPMPRGLSRSTTPDQGRGLESLEEFARYASTERPVT